MSGRDDKILKIICYILSDSKRLEDYVNVKINSEADRKRALDVVFEKVPNLTDDKLSELFKTILKEEIA